jgi:hypothetical protein
MATLNPASTTTSKRTQPLTEQQEILMMKQRVKEMEEEAAKLRELQEQQAESEGGPMETDADSSATDSRSIYVGNVSILSLYHKHREVE